MDEKQTGFNLDLLMRTIDLNVNRVHVMRPPWRMSGPDTTLLKRKLLAFTNRFFMNEGMSAQALTLRLRQAGYIADHGLATALGLAESLQRALLLEGEAGVGKSEAARALAQALGAPFIRLQCYEGIDVHDALYEWNYPRQLLAIRAAESSAQAPADLYSEAFLIRRPLLQALAGEPAAAVLLIDEIDRADDEFEAFLLEFLQDYAVTIPELGRISAARVPIVILTSNRTRDLHDALKRRCYYHWIAYPTPARELEILRLRLPEIEDRLLEDVTRAIAELRRLELRKLPGIAEAIDWAMSAHALGAERLEAALDLTLGAVLKYPEDIETARAHRADLIA